MLFLRCHSDVLYGIDLSMSPAQNDFDNNYTPINPVYRDNIVWTNGGVLAQYVRIHVMAHHDNQGYRFDLTGCPALREGQPMYSLRSRALLIICKLTTCVFCIVLNLS